MRSSGPSARAHVAQKLVSTASCGASGVAVVSITFKLIVCPSEPEIHPASRLAFVNLNRDLQARSCFFQFRLDAVWRGAPNLSFGGQSLFERKRLKHVRFHS